MLGKKLAKYGQECGISIFTTGAHVSREGVTKKKLIMIKYPENYNFLKILIIYSYLIEIAKLFSICKIRTV